MAVVMLLAMVSTAVGCASQSKKWKFATWDVRKAVGLKKDEERPAPEVPTRLVATWTETVLNKAGQPPTRGFGGRIAFFKQASDDAVRVDGQLVVYAFDETSRPSHETHPSRRFIFPADEIVRHESESKLGPAYSFWLPWDEVGGPQRNISLIARFEPKGGPIVVGEQTKHFLPGASLDATPSPQVADGENSAIVNKIRLATYADDAVAAMPALAEPPSGQAGEDKLRMSTATIALPSRLGAAVQREGTKTFDARATGGLPISQLAALPSQQQAVAGVCDPGALGETPASQRPATPRASAPAAAGSLRDSLLETLPARARQSARAASDRAR